MLATGKKSDKFTYRGDPATFDYGVGDFTIDNGWHDLDLSGKIPVGTKLVCFVGQCRTNLKGYCAFFQRKGNVNTINRVYLHTQGDELTMTVHFWLSPNDARIVEYMFNATGVIWRAFNLCVSGWFK